MDAEAEADAAADADKTEDDELDEWSGQQDPLTDPDERAHLYAVLDSFRQYRRHTLFTTTHVRRQAFYALPQAHWQLLAAPPVNLLDTLCDIDDAIAANAAIADAIYHVSLASMGLAADEGQDAPPWAGTATPNDHTKARSTIHQLYRDWSADGAHERAGVFDPIFADLAAFLPVSDTTSPPAILVPGAGLGRLVFELSRAGYAATGNEISYHQLLTSAWVLNHTTAAATHALHPFATQFSNVRARADQLREVRIPDICPPAAPPAGPMAMAAGDFCDLYGPAGSQAAGAFDAVATLFFIDTAPDLLRYIAAVRRALRPGGLWCNVGPLLWHFEPPPLAQDESRADGERPRRDRIGAQGSFELAHDEVLALVGASGFVIERADDAPATTYVGNDRALLESRYKPVHWVARRV